MKAEAEVLRPQLQALLAAYDQGQLDIPEVLFLLIATVCEKRRSKEWWMRGASEFEFIHKKNTFFAEAVIRLGVPFSGQSLADFFKSFRIKKLPTAVTRILHMWQSEKQRLHLLENAITPIEMLGYQSRGERVITLDRKSLLCGQFVDGRRDALEFLLHDMAHAHLFFSETHNEQVLFFKTLRDVLGNSLPQGDHLFITALEYIMSDMNSSVAHLQHSLKAAVIDKRRRELSLPTQERLSIEEEQGLNSVWGQMWL